MSEGERNLVRSILRTHPHSHSLTVTHSLTLTHSPSFTVSHPPSLSCPSLTHPPTHSLTHPQSVSQSVSHSLTHGHTSRTHPQPTQRTQRLHCSFVRSFVRACVRSFARSFVGVFVCAAFVVLSRCVVLQCVALVRGLLSVVSGVVLVSVLVLRCFGSWFIVGRVWCCAWCWCCVAVVVGRVWCWCWCCVALVRGLLLVVCFVVLGVGVGVGVDVDVDVALLWFVVCCRACVVCWYCGGVVFGVVFGVAVVAVEVITAMNRLLPRVVVVHVLLLAVQSCNVGIVLWWCGCSQCWCWRVGVVGSFSSVCSFAGFVPR